MTINIDTKVTRVTYEEKRDTIRRIYATEIDGAREAALAVPAMPRGSYRLRLAQAVAKAAPTMTERDLYTVWKDDPDLLPIARTMHNVVCDAKLGQLAVFVGQLIQEGQNNIERY
jgi:hypothetical protein